MIEHNPTPFETSDADRESDVEKTSKKRSRRHPASRSPEKSADRSKQNKAAKKLAEPRLWERLNGEQFKNEPDEKPKSVESVEAKRTASEPEVEKEVALKELSGEIPLNADTRAAAEGYIDLRAEEVGKELAAALPESKDLDEAGADALLLKNAQSELEAATDNSPIVEAIDEAYEETVRELVQRVPDGMETTPTVPPIEALMANPAIVEQLHAEESFASAVTAENTSSVNDESPILPRKQVNSRTAEHPTWYSPTLPKKQAVPKTEASPLNLDNKPNNPNPQTPQTFEQQTQAVEHHISERETDVRTIAHEQFATAPTPAEYAPFTSSPIPSQEHAPTETFLDSYNKSKLTNPETPKYTLQMDQRELLKASEKVIIEGVSLRTIYEAKQVTEQGFKRIMNEYLRGGDLKRTLDEELRIKEMAYERDPLMRERLAASYASVQAATQPAAPVFAPPAPASPQLPPPPVSAPAPSPPVHHDWPGSDRTEQIITYTWGAIIAVLSIIALVLLFR